MLNDRRGFTRMRTDKPNCVILSEAKDLCISSVFSVPSVVILLLIRVNPCKSVANRF